MNILFPAFSIIIASFVCVEAYKERVGDDANSASLRLPRDAYWADRCPQMVDVSYAWRVRCHVECVQYKKSTQYCSKPMGLLCCKKYLHAKKPDCSRGADGYYPDYYNCEKYYQCYSKTLYHRTCPSGGVWSKNVNSPACLQIYDPVKECGNRLYHPTCALRRFITITFVIKNSPVGTPVHAPPFSGTVLRQPLYNIMLDMAGSRTDFSFTTTLHPIFWRSISCIDGICGKWNPDKTYWSIKDNGATLPVGVSSFIPNHEDVIVFELLKSN